MSVRRSGGLRAAAALFCLCSAGGVLAAGGAGTDRGGESGADAAATADFTDRWQALTADVERLLTDQQMVGGALWFVDGGRVAGRYAYGSADIAAQRPVDDATIFHWASITKTFTGIAIMQLRDRGLLSLDDPVADYLPEIRAIHNPHGGTITLRHVMTHATGMRASTWPWGGGESWHPFEPTRWSQLTAMFPYTELAFAPGSRYAYSNPAIILLGRIIETVSGEPYEAYVAKHVFMPLGMTRSYFDRTPPHLAAHRANNYTVRDGSPRPNGPDFDTGITVSNSGLNAPLGDMASYAAFLAGSAPPGAYDSVLSRTSLQEMFQPRLPMTDPVAVLDGVAAQHIGLTFFVVDTGRTRLVGHTGSQQAFRAFLYVDPQAGTAAIAAFNAAGTGPAPRPDAEAVLARVRALTFAALFD